MADRKPWLIRTGADQKVMEKAGLDDFTLRRVRKSFNSLYATTGGETRRSITEGGTPVRFAFMFSAIAVAFNPQQRSAWLTYLRHDDHDIRDMCRGEHPIGPMVVRVMSALVGIKVDFLLLGTAPTVNRLGDDLNPWPLTQTR